MLDIQDRQQFLDKASGWEYFYNLARPHYGKDMNEKTPFEKLRRLGYDLPEEFALLPPVILDTISTDWLLRAGNNLLAHVPFGDSKAPLFAFLYGTKLVYYDKAICQ